VSREPGVTVCVFLQVGCNLARDARWVQIVRKRPLTCCGVGGGNRVLRHVHSRYSIPEPVNVIDQDTAPDRSVYGEDRRDTIGHLAV